MYESDMVLSLNSDTFQALKEDFDSILSRTIGNMEMKNAGSATITLKLGIDLDKELVVSGGVSHEVTKPTFKHDISSVVQVKDKKSGALTGDYQLVWNPEEGNYIMRRIDNGQTSMFDEDESVTADCAEVEEARLLPAGDPADDTGYEYDSPEEEL